MTAGETFSLRVDGVDEGALTATAFHGREAVNDTYCYSIEAVTELPLTELEGRLFHQCAELQLLRAGAPVRRIRGRIQSVELRGYSGARADRRRALRVELVPSLAFLRHSRNSRIFQDHRIPDIVDVILDAWGIPHRWHLRLPRPPHLYCVQHEESDYDFVTRILAAEGLFFYFATVGADEARAGSVQDGVRRAEAALRLGSNLAQTSFDPSSIPQLAGQLGQLAGQGGWGDSVMILGDTPGAMSVAPSEVHTEAVDPVVLHARAEGGLETGGDSIFDLHYQRQTVPGRVRLRDYQPENARYDLHVSHSHEGLGAEGLVGTVEGMVGAHAGAIPDEVQRGLSGLAAGVSGAGGQVSQGVLEAAGAVVGAVDPRRGLLHRMSVYEFHPDLPLAGEGALTAQVALEQLQNDSHRLAATTHSARLSAGYALEVDNHDSSLFNGLYMVTELTLTERRDEPLRCDLVAIPGRACPRPARRPRPTRHVVDTAVVVGPAEHEIHTDSMGRVRVHFHWDRDRPAHEQSSCWLRVAQGWSGAGFGMHFLPRVGTEVLVSYLGGDIDRPVVIGTVPNSSNPVPFTLPGQQATSGIVTRTVPHGEGFNALTFDDQRDGEAIRLHAQRDLEGTVRRNHQLEVLGDETTRVHGTRHSESGRHHQRVEGAEVIDVGGDRTLRVTGRDEREVRGPSRAAYLDGRSHQVEGTSSSSVRGRDRQHVEGQQTIVVEGGRIVRVEGPSLLQVGTETQPQSHVQHVKGMSIVEATEGIELISAESITLRCGNSTVAITPAEVIISTPKLRLEGETLESVGETVNVEASDMIRLQADRIIALSSGASLGLTSDATLDGANVSLKTPPDEDSGPDAPADPAEPTIIELVDQNGDPLAGQRYVIELENGARRWGVLDDEGRAEVRGLEGSASIMFPDINEWEPD